jgi:TonB family protein
MTAALWLRDLVSLTLQLALIVAAGVILARVFGLRAPAVMLRYWQVLLVACLLLPLGQPWKQSLPPLVETSAAVETADSEVTSKALVEVEPKAPSWSAEFLILAVIGTGIVLRALWLIVGAWRLRCLRRTATCLTPPPPSFITARERIGTRAEICVSNRITGPITFGLFRPVVIVPAGFASLPAHVQEAIAHHELLHVSRRDWLSEVIEEMVRTVFWFHPAVWWLISRIQLTREQVVDRATIHLTESRERYVDALVVVALSKSPVALVPAPLFMRKSLLKQRVAQILQETNMTTRRLIASLSACAAALALVTMFAIRSFPLEAQGQPSISAEPIQILKGGDHLLHATMPEYPRRAIEQRIEGDVQLELSLDDRGEVSDARVLTGPDELRRAALESVLQWHYSPAAVRSTSLQTTLRFRLPAEGVMFKEKQFAFAELKAKEDVEWKAKEEIASEESGKRQIMELEKALQDEGLSDRQKEELRHMYAERVKMFEKVIDEREEKPPLDGTRRLVQIASERVTPETMKELRAHTGISVGDALTEADVKRIHQVARSIDEHLRVNFRGDGHGGLIMMVVNP